MLEFDDNEMAELEELNEFEEFDELDIFNTLEIPVGSIAFFGSPSSVPVTLTSIVNLVAHNSPIFLTSHPTPSGNRKI
jgi:hypothetical protein